MEVFWDNRVVIDLFLGGAGVGAFLIGAILFYLNPQKYESIIKRSWIVSPFLIILGLIVLITELGRPYNIMQAVFNANPTSFMAIGVYLQGICVLLMLIVMVRISNIQSVSKPLVYLTVFFATLVGLYHGFLLTGMEKTVWNSSTPIIFFLSSLSAGAAFSLLISVSTNGYENAMESPKLPLVFNSTLSLLLISILSWVYSLSTNSAEAKSAYMVLNSTYSTQLWIVVILIGIIAPLAMLTLALMKKIETKSVFLPTAICVLVGSFFLKHLFVYFGQMV